jgi:radical SAM protein (TIGR04043 family)/putative N-acetyltransferase (TIGR04045 family)
MATMAMTLADYVVLQSQGVRIDEREAVRRGGAGPADAGTYVIDGRPVMMPALGRSARNSRYALIPEDGMFRLEKDGKPLCRVNPVSRPRFYAGATADGIPYVKIARLHGKDCLASTVVQECVRYNSPETRCRFCAIGASLAHGSTIRTKTPAQLAEVALAAKRLDGVTHVTLTAGTSRSLDDRALYLAECAAAIQGAAGLPVEIQFEPLRDKSLYSRLRSMGVTDVGMHVESFDPAVRRRMTPGKAEIGLEEYFDAFAEAVAVFGRNKVSTYVILGMGEDETLTLEGCARAAALGVYPVVVPLRPLLDSCLAEAEPVDPEYLGRMYRVMGSILQKNGLSAESSTAGCVRCKACSLLQFTESVSEAGGHCAGRCPGVEPEAPPATIRQARTAAEIRAYMRLREDVFVTEQAIFPSTDRDGHDASAIVIIAEANGTLVGGVRCYPGRGGVWFGGRLAVDRNYRNGANLGALLVRKAVETMRERGDVRRFLALVQLQNRRFFQRLGWTMLGKPFFLRGCRHQMMEYPLTEIQDGP